MKILHLTLKKKWFDMIASGEKKEEYREVKDYWHSRLMFKEYDVVSFRNGYAKNAPKMLIEVRWIEICMGVLDWGAPANEAVYIIKLGKILSIDNRGIDCEV
jgi:hypothetical protein